MQERMMNKEDLEKRDFLLQFWDHLGDVDKDIRDASTLSHVDAKKGTCTVVFTVGQKHVNGFGKLHGGVICTIVDIIGTFALLACQPPDKYVPGVSTDINVSFFHGTDLGSQVLVEAKVLKNGKNLVFIQVDLIDKQTGILLAQGRHTKALTKPRDSIVERPTLTSKL